METPKGTRVFYPSDAERRRWVRTQIERVVRQYGFDAVVTPAFERATVYTEKSGDDIVDELFLLDDDVGASRLALTPELTPTIGRMVAAEQQRLAKPIKWYSTQRFWRYEEPQQGRFREFWQTNVDVFGVGEPSAEAELVMLASDVLDGLGIDSNDVTIRVSDRRVLDALIDEFTPDGSNTEVMRVIDKRRKLDRSEYKTRLRALGIDDVDEFDSIVSSGTLDAVRSVVDADIVEPLASLVDRLEESGREEWVSVDIGTARGLDYYTGIVFEAFDTTGAVQRSLLGGGRYDNLVESYGGEPMSAVGLAFGYAPLEEVLDAYGSWPSDRGGLDAYVIRFDETASVSDALRDSLRDDGYRVDGALQSRSLGAQFGVADARNAAVALVPGPDEVERNVVTVQRMRDGAEAEVSLDAVLNGELRLEEVDFAS